MPRPSQQDKIRDAALACFAQRGYDATRISHIAQRAEVSGGALYSHFHSKEALAQILFRAHLERCSRELDAIVGGDGTVKERLLACIRAGLALYREETDAFTFVLLRQQSFMPDLPRGFTYPVNVIERLVAEGQRQRTVKRGDAKLLASISLGCMLRPLIVSQLAAPGSFDPLRDDSDDELIAASAWAAIAR